MPRRLVLLVLGALLLGLAACGGDAAGGAAGGEGDAAAEARGGERGERGDGPEVGPLDGELVVFAAASLTDVVATATATLEAAHPDLVVIANHAGSQQLAGQLLEGAPADVFASASDRPMDRLAEAGLLDGDPEVFAVNRLEIAVEPGNPQRIRGLGDLARADLVVVLADPAVPAGAYAAQALAAAGVEVAPASLEVDVRAVLGKVALGEADAGIVYRTDVAAAGDRVTGVPIPDAENVLAEYPVAALDGAENPVAARAFVDLLRGDQGRRMLTDAGFDLP